MSSRGRSSRSIFAHPRVVGGLALVVAVAAVMISYQATSGLPFVPKYHVNVQVPNAAQLVDGAEVTIAGDRVGQVTAVDAEARTDSRPIAVLELEIDKRYEPLPVDSTVVIKRSGSIGRKVVEITPGDSNEGVGEGETLPLRQARPAIVELDEVLNTFGDRTRAGMRGSLEGLGIGFAGRGTSVNIAIAEFAPLLSDLQVAMGTLADPRTELARFLNGLEGVFGELAPIAETTASLVGSASTTFGALAAVSPSLRRALAEAPSTEDAITQSARTSRPFLRSATALFRDLEPGAADLAKTAPSLEAALTAGAENLPLVPGLAQRLDRVLARTADFAEAPSVRPGFARITEFAKALDEPLAFITPAQTTCSYAVLLIRNMASVFKEKHATGTTLRAGGVVTGYGLNSERGPAVAPSAIPPAKALGPVHSNPYPNTAAPGQTLECEAGREPYITNRPVIGNVPGNQGAKTEDPSLP